MEIEAHQGFQSQIWLWAGRLYGFLHGPYIYEGFYPDIIYSLCKCVATQTFSYKSKTLAITEVNSSAINFTNFREELCK